MTTNPTPPIVPNAQGDDPADGLIQNDEGDLVLDPDAAETSIDSVDADRISSVSPDSDLHDRA